MPLFQLYRDYVLRLLTVTPASHGQLGPFTVFYDSGVGYVDRSAWVRLPCCCTSGLRSRSSGTSCRCAPSGSRVPASKPPAPASRHDDHRSPVPPGPHNEGPNSVRAAEPDPLPELPSPWPRPAGQRPLAGHSRQSVTSGPRSSRSLPGSRRKCRSTSPSRRTSFPDP